MPRNPLLQIAMFYRQESDHLESEEILAQRERQLRVLQLLLLIVFIGAFYHMATGPAPWSNKILDHIKDAAPDLASPRALVMLPAWLNSDVTNPGVLRVKEHAVIGLWWGAAFAAATSFLLLLTSQWWMPRGQKEGAETLVVEETNDENAGDTGLAKLVSSGPIFFGLVALAVCAGAWFRAPELGHSLWNDEEYAMRRFANGSWVAGDEGKREFEPVPWQETLFKNGEGNNHILHSILSRLSLSFWKGNHSGDAGRFDEAALRMPSMIAGVAAIALVAFLGWEIGLPWIGIGAAWLLALHPWHIRYSAEAKGYSLMIMFLCLALLGLVRAMKRHRNRDWQMFAIGEAGLLLSFAGAVYVVLAVNVVAVVELLARRQPRRLVALLAFNALAALPVVVLTLPSYPQVMGFMHREAKAAVPSTEDRLHDLGSHIATGTMYQNLETNDHLGTSWTQLTAANHVEPMVLAYGLGMFLVLGFIASLFENTAARVVIIGVTLGGALAFWRAGVQHQPNFAWYYIYLLIPAVLAVSLAAVRLQFMPALIVVLFVGFFGKATDLPRSLFINHDRQPIRETVASIREKKPESLTGTFGVSDRQAQSYDPNVRLLSKPEDVDKLLAEGKEAHVPVFIYFCGVTESTNRKPELVKRVAASEDFLPYKQVKGLEAMFSYHGFLWRDSPL